MYRIQGQNQGIYATGFFFFILKSRYFDTIIPPKTPPAMKKILFIILICLSGMPAILSQEFLLHDKTYTWHADDDVCGGYSYWYDHGNAPTMNWTYPYDYQNGLFYYYFEIINQPSSAPFQLNFCIWADRSTDGTTWQESCGYRSSVLAGPGSSAQFSSPVLPAWNGGIDWTDLSKLWRYGIPLWVNGHNMGNGPFCTDNPEEWANQALYFPLVLRVVVVAVASGHNFSGWSNYLGGCSTPAQPGAISGNANPTQGASETYSISAVSGATSYTWTLPSGWTGTSTTSSITTTVGSNSGTIYVTANNGCGASTARSLAVTVGVGCTPTQLPTPTYGINYSYERTDKAVPATDEYSYSSNMSGAVSGTGSYLYLTPGTDVYFRTKASGDCYLASNIQHLVVPARTAVTPAYTINYVNERTNENVSTTVAYSTSPSYTSPVNGTGAPVTLTPGQDLYFWVKETASSFASLTQHLTVPARPSTPAFTINYQTESTATAVPTDCEYANNAGMTSAVSGTGSTIPLTPGSTLYFRKKATSSQFVSAVQTLVIPVRPATPAYTVNYSIEHTAESIPVTVEYSASADMSAPNVGSGSTLGLVPGTDLYFRVKYTPSSFASSVFLLSVDQRPVLTTAATDTVNAGFTAAIDFHQSVTGFAADDIEVTNATVTHTGGLNIKIDPVATGDVTVKVVANAVSPGNFASDVFKTYYKVLTSSGPGIERPVGSLLVYPSPFDHVLYLDITRDITLPVDLKILNGSGAAVIHKILVSSKSALEMEDVPAGLYILKAIDADGKEISCKVIKQ
jgi:hypothetical protein